MLLILTENSNNENEIRKFLSVFLLLFPNYKLVLKMKDKKFPDFHPELQILSSLIYNILSFKSRPIKAFLFALRGVFDFNFLKKRN